MNLKLVLLYCLFSVSFTTYSQTVVGLPEMNILYRGYDNKVDFGSSLGDSSLTITGHGCEVKKVGEEWIVNVTGSGRVASLKVSDQEGNNLATHQFRVSNLPKPILNWRPVNPDSNDLFRSILFASYTNGCPLKSNFRTRDWHITIGTNTYSGKGHFIGQEVEDAILNFPAFEFEVEVIATVADENGQQFKLERTFRKENYYGMNLTPSSNSKITLIQKDSSNSALFNEDDPMSLMGMIRSNVINKPSYMRKASIERLERSGLDLNSIYYTEGYQSADRLVIADTTSEFYGQALVVAEADGTLVYVYPERERFYYDLDNIDLLVIFEDTVTNLLTGENYWGISQIGLAKKYPNSIKYDLVMLIPYEELTTLGGFVVAEKVAEGQAKEYYEFDRHNSFGNELRNWCFGHGNHFINDSLEAFYKNSPDFLEKVHILPNIEDIESPRSTGNYSSLGAATHIQSPFSYEYKMKDLERSIDSIYSFKGDYFRFRSPICTPWSNEPRERVEHLYWIDVDSTDVWLLKGISKMDHSGRPVFGTIQVVYTVDLDGKNIPVLAADVNEIGYPVWRNGNNSIRTDKLEWRLTLMSEMESRKKQYDLSSKKDVKALGKLFYLDSYNDQPANLFGVY